MFSRRRRALLGTSLVFALVAAGLVGYLAAADRSVVVKSRLMVMGEFAERTYYSLDTAAAATEIASVLSDSADTEIFLSDVRTELASPMTITRLRQAIKVTSVADVPIVEIAVSTATAASAEQISSAVLTALSGMAEELAQQRLTGEATITTRVVMEPLLVDRESLPIAPIAAFILVAALAVGVAAAFLRDLLDTKVRDVETVSRNSGAVPVVASVEAVRARLATLDDSRRTVLVLPVGDGGEEPLLAEELATLVGAWDQPVVLIRRDSASESPQNDRAGLVRTVLLDAARPVSETLSPRELDSIRAGAAGATLVIAVDSAAWQTTLQTVPADTRYVVGIARIGSSKVVDVRDAATALATAGPDDAVILAS